jgi:alkylation response protein AidB-like acyl-CoA dehydrogenase
VTQVAIYNEELARAGVAPLLGRAGITLVGPTLMTHGTEAQRARWMRRILSGDDVWCQLFSEPDAGSDLAGLTSRATKSGGVYRVTGQKVWSSHARWADMGIALVRTDPDAPAHKGISMLAIPMGAKGVDIRPLRQITGDAEFSEVFLDDVEVPVDHLIGAEHDGWRVANTTLANERGASFIWREQVLQQAAVMALATACRTRALADDPVVRQRLAQLWIDAELFRLFNARTLERLARGDEIGSESSLVKLHWAISSQRLYETATTLLGTDALGVDGLDDDRWIHGLLATRANSIQGGTSEIQRNVIGERVLGLPREPR